MINGCPGAYNISDDIVIVGATRQEHDERLLAVVKRLHEKGLTLNPDKCQIGITSIKYMGHILTGSEGIKVCDDKVKAITHAPEPKNNHEVRSFLGSVMFCSRFIKDFATISQPLWDLTRAGVTWKWDKPEQQAFDEIKCKLTTAPIMAYFKSGAKTRITTDASKVGLCAIVEQEQADGEYRPVYYSSRKLTDVETRYSQFEREALAIRWACQKFHLFIYGINFEILTDHKPLVTVYGDTQKPANARLERWRLNLQPYSYTIRHSRPKEPCRCLEPSTTRRSRGRCNTRANRRLCFLYNYTGTTCSNTTE